MATRRTRVGISDCRRAIRKSRGCGCTATNDAPTVAVDALCRARSRRARGGDARLGWAAYPEREARRTSVGLDRDEERRTLRAIRPALRGQGRADPGREDDR